MAAAGVATTEPSGDPVGDGELLGDVDGELLGLVDGEPLGFVDGEPLGDVVVTAIDSCAVFLCLSLKTMKHVPALRAVIFALYDGPLPLAGDKEAMPLHEAATVVIAPVYPLSVTVTVLAVPALEKLRVFGLSTSFLAAAESDTTGASDVGASGVTPWRPPSHAARPIRNDATLKAMAWREYFNEAFSKR